MYPVNFGTCPYGEESCQAAVAADLTVPLAAGVPPCQPGDQIHDTGDTSLAALAHSSSTFTHDEYPHINVTPDHITENAAVATGQRSCVPRLVRTDTPPIALSHLLPYRHLVRPDTIRAPIRLPLPRRTRSPRTPLSTRGDAGGTSKANRVRPRRSADVRARTAAAPSAGQSSSPHAAAPHRLPRLASVEFCTPMGASPPRSASARVASDSQAIHVTLPYARWMQQTRSSNLRRRRCEQDKCASDRPLPSADEKDVVYYVGSRVDWAAAAAARRAIPASSFSPPTPLPDRPLDRMCGEVSKSAEATGGHGVSIHVYNLHEEWMSKHSKAVLGVHVDGLYHSSVVCYGLEFYFEGGVAVAAAGRTRFGTRFVRYAVGSTTHNLTDFLDWLRAVETTTYHRASYHLTRHNCHHFTQDAVGWLVGAGSRAMHPHACTPATVCSSAHHTTVADCTAPPSPSSPPHPPSSSACSSSSSPAPVEVVPSFLFDTVQCVLDTEVGGAVLEAVWHMMQGYQYLAARQELRRVRHRLSAATMLQQAARYSGVLCTPPSMVVVFGTPMREAGDMRDACLRRAKGGCHVDADGAAQQWVQRIIVHLLHRPPSQWAPLLVQLRRAMLRRVCALVCAFDTTVLSALLLASRDYSRLPRPVRRELLRVLCQWGSAAGAGWAVYTAPAYGASWVALAGMGMRELRDEEIRYSAACLAVNLSVALAMAWAAERAGSEEGARGRGGGEGEGRRRRSRAGGQSDAVRHCLRQLVTVLLFSLRFHVARGEPTAEGTLHMMLLALVHAMSSGSAMVNVVMRHRFRLPYYELLARARSNESRALLCILHALEDMHQVT